MTRTLMTALIAGSILLGSAMIGTALYFSPTVIVEEGDTINIDHAEFLVTPDSSIIVRTEEAPKIVNHGQVKEKGGT